MPQQKNDAPAFSLEKFGKNEWQFIYSPELNPLITQFDQVAQDLTPANAETALKLFDALKKQLPQYIDLYNLTALIHLWRKEYEAAIDIIETGLDHIRQLFPDDFFKEQPLVEWSIKGNRPFLSCLSKLGISLSYTKRYRDAIDIFEQLMMMNPQDHLGIRNLLLWVYLKEEWISAAKDLCVFYKDDMLPSLSYGYALVLYKQGELEQAELQLATACEFSPTIAENLLKTKPENFHEDFLTLFEKPDDAQVYAHNYGVFWHATEGALALLRKVFK